MFHAFHVFSAKMIAFLTCLFLCLCSYLFRMSDYSQLGIITTNMSLFGDSPLSGLPMKERLDAFRELCLEGKCDINLLILKMTTDNHCEIMFSLADYLNLAKIVAETGVILDHETFSVLSMQGLVCESNVRILLRSGSCDANSYKIICGWKLYIAEFTHLKWNRVENDYIEAGLCDDAIMCCLRITSASLREIAVPMMGGAIFKNVPVEFVFKLDAFIMNTF